MNVIILWVSSCLHELSFVNLIQLIKILYNIYKNRESNPNHPHLATRLFKGKKKYE